MVESLMKVLYIVMALLAGALAEGSANWAEEAALKYEAKAASALTAGKAEHAAIYTKMAAIKRAAGKASAKGKSFSWDEYHELEVKLSKLNHQKSAAHCKKCK